MIKKEEAKKRIRELWREQPLDKRKYADARAFYLILQQEHPELLDFRLNRPYDKWQIVKGFISGLIER